MTNLLPKETTESPVIFKLLPEDHFFQVIDDIHTLIARRAYKLFSASGFTHGHDLEHWLKAESEIMESVSLEVSETPEAITAKAKLPGLRAKDIEIHVEPRRLFVSGQREEKTNSRKEEKASDSEQFSNWIFCALDLPAVIDPEKASATFSNDQLQIKLPKQKEETLIAAKAAA